MISTEEFLARAQRIGDEQGKARDRDEELFKELQALCVLTGMTAARSGDLVSVYGRNSEPVMSGPVGEVVEALVAPPPSAGLFGLFPGVPVEIFAEDAAREDDAPVHIERRAFVLLSELAECLSDYLDALA
jgi:hypothetical protein